MLYKTIIFLNITAKKFSFQRTSIVKEADDFFKTKKRTPVKLNTKYLVDYGAFKKFKSNEDASNWVWAMHGQVFL